MMIADRVTLEDLPDSPHSRQLKAGFAWLTFDAEIEARFRCSHLDENLPHIRINLCLAVTITLALSAVEARILGPQLNRIPNLIHLVVMLPILLACLAATFSPQRQRLYAICAPVAGAMLGLSVLAIQLIASLGGVSTFFPCLVLTSMFVYFMGGLVFYHALAANLLVMFALPRRRHGAAAARSGLRLRRHVPGGGKSVRAPRWSTCTKRPAGCSSSNQRCCAKWWARDGLTGSRTGACSTSTSSSRGSRRCARASAWPCC